MKKTEKILNTLLQELSLSRSEVSKSIGVSLQAISNWCNRDSLPKKAKVYFHKKHNVSYSFLETSEGPIFEGRNVRDVGDINKYLKHLEKENEFLRNLVKTLTKFNDLPNQ